MSYSCKRCDKTFKNEYNWKRHENMVPNCVQPLICPNCGKNFEHHRNRYLQHVKYRKTPCMSSKLVARNSSKEYQCSFCKGSYSTVSNRNKHERKCSKRPQNDKDSEIALMKQRLREKEQELIKQKKIIQNMERRIGAVNNTMNTTNNTMNVTNITNNIHINILPFGSENIKKLDAQTVARLLEGNISHFLPKMVQYVHANPEVPENQNIIFDATNNQFLLMGTDEWMQGDPDQTMIRLRDNVQRHIQKMQPQIVPHITSDTKDNCETVLMGKHEYHDLPLETVNETKKALNNPIRMLKLQE